MTRCWFCFMETSRRWLHGIEIALSAGFSPEAFEQAFKMQRSGVRLSRGSPRT
jgi:hypothetical protein